MWWVCITGRAKARVLRLAEHAKVRGMIPGPLHMQVRSALWVLSGTQVVPIPGDHGGNPQADSATDGAKALGDK